MYEIAFVCRDLFPSSRCLFLYRDVVEVAKSMYRLSMAIPVLRLASLVGSCSGQLMKLSADLIQMSDSFFCVRLENDLTFGSLYYIETASVYLAVRRRGFNVSALRYEDLVARPLDMCRVILEFCHLPVSLAELAVTAFDRDSQRNSRNAKSRLRRFKDPQLTPHKKAQLNELLKKFGLPLIGESDILEGTLYC